MARGRNRGKLNVEFISNERSRNSTFIKRKDGLMKKIYELSTLCGIDACMIAYGPKRDQPYIWPENEEKVRRILTRYKEHPDKNEIGKRCVDLVAYVKAQKQKIEHDIARMRQQNEELENAAKQELVESLNEEQLRTFSCALDSKLQLIKERIASRKEEVESQGETGTFDYSDSSVLDEQSQFPNMPANMFHGWQNVNSMHLMQVHEDAKPLSYSLFMTDPMTPTSSNAFDNNQIYLDQMSDNFEMQNPHFQYQGLIPASNGHGFGYVNQGSPIMSSFDSFSSNMQPKSSPIMSSFDSFSSNMQPKSSPYVLSYQPCVLPELHNQMSESQDQMVTFLN